MPKKKKTTQKSIVKRIYLGRDEDGKPKYKKVSGKTESEAAEKALLMKIKLRKGIDVSADRDTFKRGLSAGWQRKNANYLSLDIKNTSTALKNNLNL